MFRVLKRTVSMSAQNIIKTDGEENNDNFTLKLDQRLFYVLMFLPFSMGVGVAWGRHIASPLSIPPVQYVCPMFFLIQWPWWASLSH